MTKITLYGASDDLIEIESTSFPDEEFNVYSPESSLLIAVSDGTWFRVRYDEDGIWRFTPVMLGSSVVDIVPGVDDHKHSDVVILRGEDLHWVVLGSQIAK
jgi:hypothetical protein